ncbi:MAG: aminotransferase class I/II-fold pyridoxal phosphate-dependent enzyme [Clostridiales bacterium]|nr:aminotransferase class I/II-fold pyridoxal phosphate-dependent enzyme [Clostridiales bacterium]
MLPFLNDYQHGGHPAVLAYLQSIQGQAFPGYGEDAICSAAADRIRAWVGIKGAPVHFVSGGTQANLTVIASLLRPHEGVIAATTGHINAHETGAVEATGHKVLTVENAQGKVTADAVREVVTSHANDEAFEHIVKPSMVYVSHTTELGTIYQRAELEALSTTCRALGLPLYLDGARLGYGLTAEGGDLTIADVARLTDVFTIGGTKQGALFGEAIVFTNAALAKDFRYHIKQRGGMLAKGWLLGAQFDALLKDDLYLSLSRHANALAQRLRDGLQNLGFTLAGASPSNQQFVRLPVSVADALAESCAFGTITQGEKERVVRFCTSWATTGEQVDELLQVMERLRG